MTNDSTLVMAVGERNPEFWAGDLDGGVGDRVLAFFLGQPHTRLRAFSSWLLSVLASAVSPHHHRLSAVTDLHRFAGKMR